MSELLLSGFSITVFTVCASIYFITIRGTSRIYLFGHLIVVTCLWKFLLIGLITHRAGVLFVTISSTGGFYSFT